MVDEEFRARMKHIETLIHEVEQFPDATARDHTREIVQGLLDLQGTALERIFAKLADSGAAGLALIDALAEDDLIGNILLLHDLHPLDTESRVRAAVENVRPTVTDHGGAVEVVAVADGVVRLRMTEPHRRSQATGQTLQALVEEAIAALAPEVTGIQVEEAEEPGVGPGATFVPVEELRVRKPERNRHPDGEAERCELCDAPLAVVHQHLFEPASVILTCACDACAILFSGQEGGKYRRVPRRVEVLADFRMTDVQWESLCLPIGLAFFFPSTATRRVVALYPSPAGATESLLELEAWGDLAAENPLLQELEPDVEALLVNRVGEARDYYRVPIDECFKLVGLLRKNWHGLSGGAAVWEAIAGFFAHLKQRAGVAAEVAHA